MEAHEGEAMAGYRILRDVLPSYGDLGPYRRIRQVHTTRRFATDAATRPTFVEALVRLGSERTRMSVQSRGVEAATDDAPDLTVTTGWDTVVRSGGPLEVGTTAPMCGVEINEQSPGYRDRAYRRDLFARAVDAMGCSDALRIELVDETLTVTAAEGWIVQRSRADLAGRNPCGIYVYGFVDVGEAVAAGERALGRMLRRLDENSLVTVTSEEDVYESLRVPFSELVEGWEVNVLGNLTESAAAVLAGRAPEEGAAPARIPAFSWSKGADWLMGELVAVEEGKYVLELASQTLPSERLDACIKAVESLPAKKS